MADVKEAVIALLHKDGVQSTLRVSATHENEGSTGRQRVGITDSSVVWRK
jgi:hypothetical protein